MAATVSREPSSWNPLACKHRDLPLPIVLLAKLITILFLWKANFVLFVSGPRLPLLGIFDSLAHPTMIGFALRILFALAGGCLLFNRLFRASSLALGCILILSILQSRLLYENSAIFCACIFILIGLGDRRVAARAIRYQLAILYLGAASNKVLDPDWQTGQYVMYGLRVTHSPAVALVISWGTIVFEAILGTALSAEGLVARYRKFIFLGPVFHWMLTLISGLTFHFFFFAVPAAYLALGMWPSARVSVYCAADGMWRHVGRILRRADIDGAFDWNIDAGARTANGSTWALGGDLGKSLRNLRRVVFLLPASYFGVLAVLLMNTNFSTTEDWRLSIGGRVVVLLILAFFGLPTLLSRNVDRAFPSPASD